MKKVGFLLFGSVLVLLFFILGVVAEQCNFTERLMYRLRGPKKPQPFAIPQAHRGKLKIFVLAGQSNMEGDGPLADYTPVDTRNRVFVFDHKEYRWKIGKEPVRGNRVGPSIAFAKALIDTDTSLSVGVVNCARGGTNIGQWQRHVEDDSLYAKMIKLAKAASLQGELAGLLFFQGENDAEGDVSDHPTDWAVHFEKFVADTRNDLRLPQLPVIFAQLGHVPNYELWEKVKQQQAAVNLQNVGMIKTDDLPYQTGSIHYTTSAYLTIGQRFAQKYLEVTRKTGVITQDQDPKKTLP
ncbi:MAG: sialate O-acetylesterase [Cytophagales bacterium]|jgi:hypothetical protein|nr:sialate O-acetylesterase [Cytophagales bacterium]